jgi:hypothetical protein
MTFYEWIFDTYGITINDDYELMEQFSADELEMMYQYFETEWY